MDDRLDFSIDGVVKSADKMRENNKLNQNNKQAFLDYIDSDLAPEWNTKEGQIAVGELRAFVNGRFQEYIDYLSAKIDVIENTVVPALNNINNA